MRLRVHSLSPLISSLRLWRGTGTGFTRGQRFDCPVIDQGDQFRAPRAREEMCVRATQQMRRSQLADKITALVFAA
jgi:hypothetical protein